MREPHEWRERTRLVALVAAIGAAWGVMYALYPVGLQRSGPLWLAAFRFDAFFLGAAAFVVVRRVPVLPTTRGDRMAIGAYAAFNVVLHNVGIMGGSGHLPVAAVAILTGLNPILTVIVARFVLPGTRVPLASLGGLAVGLAGVALLAVQGHDNGTRLDTTWLAITFGGVAAWSVGSVLLKAARPTLHPLALAMWAALLGAVVLQIGAVAAEPLPHADWAYAAVVLFSGLVGGLAAFLAWNGVVHTFGPQRANLSSYVSPVVASVAAWPLLGQRLQPVHALAYLLVAAGLTLTVMAARGPRAPRLAAGPE